MSFLNKKYEKIARIGEGSFGKVFLACENAESKETNSNNIEKEKEEIKDSTNEVQEKKLVALKKLKSSEKLKDQMHEINEIKFLTKISHENIIKLREVFFEKEYVYMVLDYMCYDLERLIANYHDKLTIIDIKIILYQITKGLVFLHENKLIHRDIKSSNMLIDENGLIKISDFSLIREIPEKPGLMTKNVITRFYRPPEIIFGSDNYGSSVDIWSLGCVLGECFLGDFLFKGNTDIEQLSLIFQVLGPPNEEVWKGCTDLPFFIGFEIKEPATLKKKIPNIPQDAFDLVSKMLALDPSKRINAKEILKHPFLNDVSESTINETNYAKLIKTIRKRELEKCFAKKK